MPTPIDTSKWGRAFRLFLPVVQTLVLVLSITQPGRKAQSSDETTMRFKGEMKGEMEIKGQNSRSTAK